MTLRRASWWVSLALCTCGWLLLLTWYTEPPPWIGVAFFAGAALAAIGASWAAIDAAAPHRHRWTVVLLAGAAAAVGLYTPWGMRAALALFVAGALGTAFVTAHRTVRRVTRGLLSVGTVAVVQGASVGLYATLFGHLHASRLVSFFDVWLLRALGRSVTVVGQTVHVSTASGTLAIVPSWDQFGVALGLLAWCGTGVLALFSDGIERRLRAIAKGTAVVAAYLLVRHVLLVLVSLETGSPRLFWDPVVLCLSVLPLIVLLARFSSLRPGRVVAGLEAALFSPPRTAALAGTSAFAATLFVLAALYLIPAGRVNEGTVLFDEAHGEWESTRAGIDAETYGMVTTYNYTSLYDWLSYYYPVGRIVEPIDEGTLDGCAVLVLKTPSAPYTEEEIAAIDAFVRGGGGLFVLGDHTNVFGTTTVLNPILARFGLALNYDSTYRLGSGSFTTYVPAALCFDPIMQHVTAFDFLTSCSLQAPLSAYRPIADDRILSNQADYATRDFFPKQRYNLASEFGRFVQTAAVAHGAGRVVAFTDSTCFSNFSVFMDGYPSFLLGTFAFLARENPRVPWRALFAVGAGVALAGFALLAWKRRGVHGFVAITCGVALGWTAFAGAACLLHRQAYPLPEPTDDVPFVYFDAEHSDIDIEPQPASAEEYDSSRQFDTFFVWTQRIAKIPLLVDAGGRDAVLPGRPYVVIDPRAEIDPGFADWIRDYVAAGGTMVLLDRCGRDPFGSDRLLEEFELTAGPCGSDRTIEGGMVTAHEISPSLTVYVSVVPFGEGHVVLVSDSSPFSNLSLGGAFTVPSPIRRSLYDVIFWLFRDAIGQPLDAEATGP